VLHILGVWLLCHPFLVAISESIIMGKLNFCKRESHNFFGLQQQKLFLTHSAFSIAGWQGAALCHPHCGLIPPTGDDSPQHRGRELERTSH